MKITITSLPKIAQQDSLNHPFVSVLRIPDDSALIFVHGVNVDCKKTSEITVSYLDFLINDALSISVDSVEVLSPEVA